MDKLRILHAKQLLAYAKKLSKEVHRLDDEIRVIVLKRATEDNCAILIQSLEDITDRTRISSKSQVSNPRSPKILVLYKDKEGLITNLDDLLFYLNEEGLAYSAKRASILEELNYLAQAENYYEALKGYTPRHNI
ncbi:hypothetical protein HYX18_00615 [Candidatus Woesearchaeota archaeon]|nr:hypothetical protein [Candidatus Woesearchaeota archaeon]